MFFFWPRNQTETLARERGTSYQEAMQDLSSSPMKGIGSLIMGGGMESDSYPSLRLSADQAGKIGLGKCRVGDEYEMKVKVRVSAVSKDGSTLEVVSADKPVSTTEYEEDEPKKVRGKIALSPKDVGLGDMYAEDEESEADADEDESEKEEEK